MPSAMRRVEAEPFSASIAIVVGLLLVCLPAPTLSEVAGGPAEHDLCTDALAVADGVFPSSNQDATTDGTASCGFRGQDGTADVWFVYTAPITGTASVETCATPRSNPPFDSVLSIFDSCGGSELACNDDSFDVCEYLTSSVNFPILQGASYWIRVAEYGGRMGTFVLTISSNGVNHCGDNVCATEEDYATCPDDCATLLEFADLQACFSGGVTFLPECEEFDLLPDSFVDLDDYALFLDNNFVGP